MSKQHTQEVLKILQERPQLKVSVKYRQLLEGDEINFVDLKEQLSRQTKIHREEPQKGQKRNSGSTTRSQKRHVARDIGGGKNRSQSLQWST